MTKKIKNISVMQLVSMFPDDAAAEQWLINRRWKNGIVICPHCESKRTSVRKTVKRSWRCKDCHKDFSTKTGTIMHSSNLGFKPGYGQYIL